jgi:sRNA-binding protein
LTGVKKGAAALFTFKPGEAKQMKNYRVDREECEAVVRMLTERYPSCFFKDPKLRRPLTKNIITDLQQDGFPVSPELLTAGVDWYISQFGYQYALEAGAKRIDLNGKAVGTVTQLENNCTEADPRG